MTCNGFSSYGLANQGSCKPNHYTGQGQNLLVQTDLAWNEKRPSLFYPFTILEIYNLQSHFEHDRIFFSKETLTRITPHIGAIKRIFWRQKWINGKK